MKTSRLEAFSDGVLAIIITIMVLGLDLPKGTDLESLQPLIPTFLSYVLSFIYVGIYWNNHHHLFQMAEKVNGKVLWANLFLLFSLSLLPLSTAWLGQHPQAVTPVVLYGCFLLLSAVAYFILLQGLIQVHGKSSKLAQAVGKDRKGKLSVVFYLIAIAVAFLNPMYSIIIYAIVAIIWFIPDRRIERNL